MKIIRYVNSRGIPDEDANGYEKYRLISIWKMREMRNCGFWGNWGFWGFWGLIG